MSENKAVPNMNLFYALTEDTTRAVIELYQGETALGHIIYDTPEFSGVISGLAQLRAGMKDQVAPTLDTGSRIEAIPDPAWKAELAGAIPGILLALRHPGYGWIGGLLPPHEARAMGEALLRFSEACDSPSEPKPTPKPE